MPDRHDVAVPDKNMRLAERNLMVDDLSRACDHEQRIAVLLDFRLLMCLRGVLDCQGVQVELSGNTLRAVPCQARATRSRRHDAASGPNPRVLNRNVRDTPAIGVYARGHDARIIRGSASGGELSSTGRRRARCRKAFTPEIDGCQVNLARRTWFPCRNHHARSFVRADDRAPGRTGRQPLRHACLAPMGAHPDQREPNDSPLSFRCTDGPEIKPGGQMAITPPRRVVPVASDDRAASKSASPGPVSVAQLGANQFSFPGHHHDGGHAEQRIERPRK